MKKFIDKYKEGNLDHGIEYFAVGLVLEEYPDCPSGKEVAVEFIDPFGEVVCDWRSREEIIMSEIDDEDAEYLKLSFKELDK